MEWEWMTPSPNEIVRKILGLKPNDRRRQKAAIILPQFAAMPREQLPLFAANAALFNSQLLLTLIFRHQVILIAMTEMVQPKRGGKAFHSVLESHFDFIHQLRQRRKTWQEIADLLLSEKGIRVTLYAPYRFYRRHLKRRAKGHWENQSQHHESPSARPNSSAIRPQKRLSPLPLKSTYKQPNISTKDTEQFL
jgi:hypothetical protein